MLWLNAADTYVDHWKARDGLVSHWLSEAGSVDLLLLPGPSPRAVLRQLAVLTGLAPLPPLWAMGYHQSHWNLRTQAQVAALDRNFDRLAVPLDVVGGAFSVSSNGNAHAEGVLRLEDAVPALKERLEQVLVFVLRLSAVALTGRTNGFAYVFALALGPAMRR